MVGDYEDARVKVWTFASRRSRESMEDQHLVSTDLPGNRTLVGVFDGHCGAEAARFCCRVFTRYLLANPAYADGDFAAALHQTFMQMDRLLRGSRELLEKLAIPMDDKGNPMSTGDGEDAMAIGIDYDLIKEEHGFGELKARFPEDHPCYQVYCHPGTTATVALILEKRVIVANAGDSFCCLVRDGKMVSLTVDHHKGLKGDDARVEKGGGVFGLYEGSDRHVLSLKTDPGAENYGGLEMTRTLGDIQLKMNRDLGFEHQAVSPVPDIVELDLVRGDEYLMLATDGVGRSYVHGWQEIVKMCKEKDAGKLQSCDFEPPSDSWNPDNATLLVIELKQARQHGDVSAKPVRRSSWYTQNKIEGYEDEELDMRPWSPPPPPPPREKEPWERWIDEIPDLSVREKEAVCAYMLVKFSDEEAEMLALGFKQHLEIVSSSILLAGKMEGRDPDRTREFVAKMEEAKREAVEYLKRGGQPGDQVYKWIDEFFRWDAQGTASSAGTNPSCASLKRSR